MNQLHPRHYGETRPASYIRARISLRIHHNGKSIPYIRVVAESGSRSPFTNALTCWVPVTLRRRFYDRSLNCGFMLTIDNDASIVTIKVTTHLLIVNKYSNMVKW